MSLDVNFRWGVCVGVVGVGYLCVKFLCHYLGQRMRKLVWSSNLCREQNGLQD